MTSRLGPRGPLLAIAKGDICDVAVSLWIDPDSAEVPPNDEKPSLLEMITRALEAADMSPTELGRRMGFANPYGGFHNIFKSGRTAFTPKRQRQVEDILGLPRGHFDNPTETERRQRIVRAAFEAFLQTDIARELGELDPELLRTLEKMPFFGPRLPTRDLYIMIAAAMSGKGTVVEVARAAELNARLSEMATGEAKEHRKPGLKKRD